MSSLEKRINKDLLQDDILLMSHTVIGYPSIAENIETAKKYADAGVNLIELQFPFSEPTADGPTLMIANQEALDKGTSVNDCFEAAKEITQASPTTGFIIMTYYNIIYQMGVVEFTKRASDAGIEGIIVPDLPPHEAKSLSAACKDYDISLINLVTPNTSPDRLKLICSQATGLVYCVSRTGVSGQNTLFSEEFDNYIDKVKAVTKLPLGVGFGVKTKDDVDHLRGKVQIAIVCSEAVKIAANEGIDESVDYLKSLR